MEQMECGQQEEDQFSFFTPSSFARHDSSLAVNCDWKTTHSDHSHDKESYNSSSGCVRKRLLENVRQASDENIEYTGLVKRPKTPLITAGDIAKQVQSLSEWKQSTCSSLPDIVCSSRDTTKLGMEG